MRVTPMLAAVAALSLGPLALAQTSPQTDSTSPSAASSPHQRESTSSSSSESMTGGDTSPAAASSPHQQEAISSNENGQSGHKESMKDCMAKQRAGNSSMSKDDARKACRAKMQSNSSR